MELFPAHPDLSLQISPPNSKPSSSTNWRSSRTDHHHQDHEMDHLGFWKRALHSRNPSMADPTPTRVVSDSSPNNFHHLLHGGARFLHSFHHHHHQEQPNFLRPIRGVPVYQNPPSFPFAGAHQQHLPEPPLTAANHNNSSAAANSYHQYSHHQGLMRPRFLSRFPAKRSMRAPRMRWTTTLHARFVHAVELLGGHESKLASSFVFSCTIFIN